MNILAISQHTISVSDPSGKETELYLTEVTIASADLSAITTYKIVDTSSKKHRRRYNMLTALAELDGGEGIELD